MPLAPRAEPDCAFCAITAACPPARPPVLDSAAGTPGGAHALLSTPHLVAFLDHAPISRGHVLVATRQHRVKLSDASVDEAQAVGAWLGIISRAVMRAVGDKDAQPYGDDGLGDWNVVQNNGPRAAQVVPHVHFHIIPRTSDVPDVRARSWTIFGRGQREELDDDDAEVLRPRIQDALRLELADLARREGQQVVDRLLGGRERAAKL